jgi:hypothetical protein
MPNTSLRLVPCEILDRAMCWCHSVSTPPVESQCTICWAGPQITRFPGLGFAVKSMAAPVSPTKLADSQVFSTYQLQRLAAAGSGIHRKIPAPGPWPWRWDRGRLRCRFCRPQSGSAEIRGARRPHNWQPCCAPPETQIGGVSGNLQPFLPSVAARSLVASK